MAFTAGKLLYLHIPKTGGYWVSEALKRVGLPITQVGNRHIYMEQLIKLYGKEWVFDHISFTMVRHPLTWYQSRWAFRLKAGWKPEHPLDFNCASNDFHMFVDNVLRCYPNGWVTWLYEQYASRVKYVARLENCIADISGILTLANIDFDPEVIAAIPRKNDSDLDGHGSKYWATYTPGLAQRVLDAESEVIDRYYSDFEFNPNSLYRQRPW